MDNKFKIVKGYRDNKELRLSFNELSKNVFSIDFEDWYQNGYWSDKYNPYSIEFKGEIIANVSVNIMDFILNGEEVNLIQLGTVMKKECYKNKGLIRVLMDEIDKDYKEVDGIYLFANDSVLDFYSKFGFKKSYEYKCSKKVSIKTEKTVVNLPMDNDKDWNKFVEVIKESIPYGAFQMKDNYGLIMFYLSKYMQDTVYYIKDLETYVIAEIEGEELIIHNIFSKKEVELDEVIKAFVSEIKKVNLRFSPKNKEGYELEKIEN